MSANSSVQHLAAGVGAYVGGLIVVESADGRLQHFPVVGLLSAIATFMSMWLVGAFDRRCRKRRSRPNGRSPPRPKRSTTRRSRFCEHAINAHRSRRWGR